jgi:hypothetical protein
MLVAFFTVSGWRYNFFLETAQMLQLVVKHIRHKQVAGRCWCTAVCFGLTLDSYIFPTQLQIVQSLQSMRQLIVVAD